MQVQTAELAQRNSPLSPDETLWTYNGLDCCVTLEVEDALGGLLAKRPPQSLTYAFELALQAPIMDIMLRGWLVDESERQSALRVLRANREKLQTLLNRYAYVWWEKGLNPRSPIQMQNFFYKAMGLPEIWQSQRGERKLSMNRETLEKLEVYFHAQPLLTVVLAIRDIDKQEQVLSTEIDWDRRWRTSYNIGGTTTGRLSSSASSTGTGSNTQNITPELRKVFVADPGHILIGVDLEQAESREVGWLCGELFGDWSYLDACEGSDLHTAVAKLVWPKLPWTGQAKADRALAEQPFYRQFSYRDMAKRGGHGSNYLGTPFTMGRHLKVRPAVMGEFQKLYFGAFPAIRKWHQSVAMAIQTKHVLVTPWGRSRTFYGRPNDDATLREAVAFGPQSATADRTNLGLWRVWKHLPEVQLLAQVHDAIYAQVPESIDLASTIASIRELVEITTISASGRSFTVPCEVKWGWNWGAASSSNPDGLAKWKGKVDRQRTHLLDRRL